jgi:rhodanese-related sulfurtransferase
MLDFVVKNWMLFLALVFILSMLVWPPLMRRIYGIKLAQAGETVNLVNRSNAVVVDVREPREFEQGRVPNAINIPLGSLETRLRELEKYKDRPIVLTCQSGNRSMRAAVNLRKKGFGDVYSLVGGQTAWERDNLPVEK